MSGKPKHALTGEQRQRVISVLVDKLPDELPSCSFCGKNEFWSVGDVAVLETASTMEKVKRHVDRDMVFPLVTFSCTNCGNTLLLNLKILGLGDLFDD